MSLRGVELAEIPEETVRVARAVFPKGCLTMRVRDSLGPVFADADFEELFPVRGRPVVSPARLALVSVLQFAVGLTDRQAAHAVRSRLDWKYVLSLELTDAGFDFCVLSEFRARLAGADAGRAVFDTVLRAAGEAGLVKAGKRQRTDATHVLAVTRDLNRLEVVVETLCAALNQIAEVAGDWLGTVAAPEWFDCYSARPEDSRFPSRWAARVEHGDQCGADGMVLLRAVWSDAAPAGLRCLPTVELLRQTWVQQFQHADGVVKLAGAEEHPARPDPLTHPARARGQDRGEAGSGLVRLQGPPQRDLRARAPHLITHIHTTPAPVTDDAVLEDIHTVLAERGLVPDEHLVDAGYVDAEQIHRARRDHNIDLVGPVGKITNRPQATGDFFDSTRFTIDWDQRQAVCPGGAHTRPVARRPEPPRHPGHRSSLRRTALRPLRTADLLHRRQGWPKPDPAAEGRAHDILQQSRIEQGTDHWRRRYGPHPRWGPTALPGRGPSRTGARTGR